MIAALDHMQLAMPGGREDEARKFFGYLLGLEEIEKPASLAGRGGAWFALPDGRRLHLGVEKPCRPNREAHPAFVSLALGKLARSLEDGGHPVKWDEELAPRRRFYSGDSFGSGLEFLEAFP